MKATYAFLITGLAAQQAVATWNFFDKFNTPRYNTNECSQKEKSGFDWSDLQIGQSDFQYGDFDFSKGWSCSNSLTKRDGLTKRTFGNRVIKNRCSKQKPASFGCGTKKKKGFSITDMDISVEFDVDLEFHYTMTDGSKCRQYSKCSAGGTTVKNTQCGGAISVDVFIGKHFKGARNDCEIGFHNIGFDCDAGTTYTPPKPPQPPVTSSVIVASSSVVVPPTIESSIISSPPVAIPTGGECNGESCKASSTAALTTPEAQTTPVASTPASSPPVNPPYSMIPPFGNSSVPVYVPPQTSVVVESSAVITSQTSAPAVQQSSSVVVPPVLSYSACVPGQSCEGASSAVVASSSVVVASSSAVVVSSSAVVVSSAVSTSPATPTYPPASPPDVLPKCINSWLQISTKCKDNTDKSCYCVNAEFTKSVIDCVSSWCGTDEETRQSLQFFIGICAEHIPENPKIIEDCPPYIPLNPAPATPTGGASVSLTGAVTNTPAVQTSAAVPATSSMPCTTITYGTTSITVPQVHFTTEPTNVAGANPTAPVELIPGTAPAQVPAATTPAGAVGGGAPYPIASTMGTATVPAASGTGAIRPSSPAEFTGAASPFAMVPQHAFIGALLAFFAL